MSGVDDHTEFGAPDPGELDRDVLRRLHEVLLDAAPSVASPGDWEATLSAVFAADAEPVIGEDSTAALVPDQLAWPDPIDADGHGAGDLVTGEHGTDEHDTDGGWSHEDGWQVPDPLDDGHDGDGDDGDRDGGEGGDG